MFKKISFYLILFHFQIAFANECNDYQYMLDSIYALRNQDNFSLSNTIGHQLLLELEKNTLCNKTVADVHYQLALNRLWQYGEDDSTIFMFKQAIHFRKEAGIEDETLSKAYNNIASCYLVVGRPYTHSHT